MVNYWSIYGNIVQLLVDKNKKPWTLGKSIGVGGFGEIYLAVEGQKAPTDNARLKKN